MALIPRLDLRQSQSLVMTPQLQQAIKLLQMSNLELIAYVDQELQENPLLERDEGQDDGVATEPMEQRTDEGDSEPEAPDSADFVDAETLPAASEAPLDTEYENDWSDSETGVSPDQSASLMNWPASGQGRPVDGEAFGIEQTATRATTLREHLLAQLNVDLPDPVDRVIGVHLVDMLDEAGWLSGDVGHVARLLDCSEDRVSATIERLQRFDPPGIFARDLRECLALQLEDRNRLDPAMQALLDNLDLLAKRDVSLLMRKCGVDAEDFADMVAEIRQLNPKPASAFDHEVAQTVNPDILMRPQPNGGWLIELNSDTLPRVLLDRRYYTTVSRAARSSEEKDYISERFQSASWLVKALHQRANTILKVASEIVRQQDAFFVHGVQHLRPLILRNIAEAIDMHESTVSRVTSNKYISTPRGVYELKYFFTSAIASANGGDAHSAEAVRSRIKDLIDAEPPKRVLSDDRIVDNLRANGIDIARRTVAKYREAMKIPSSVQRRREKALDL